MSSAPWGGDDDGAHRPEPVDLASLDDDLSLCSDEALRHRLIDLHALRDRIDAAVCDTTRVFSRRRLHDGDATRSTPSWVAARCEVTRTQAKHEDALGAAMDFMPVMAAALRAGRIGVGKARALAAIRNPELETLIADQEGFLVEQIADLDVVAALRWLEAWLQQARLMVGWTDPDDPVDTHEPRAKVDLTQTFQGRYELGGELDADCGTTLATIIGNEVDEMWRLGVFSSDDGLTPAERRGEALMNLVSRKNLRKERHGAPVPSVQVIVDEKTLVGEAIGDVVDLARRICQYHDGRPLNLVTMGRYLCGARVHRLVVDADGEVLDAGKDIRLANRAQTRALMYKHGGRCAFPGCFAPAEWTENHHIERWDPDPTNPAGGTNLAVLAPFCCFHHHQVHEGGYLATLDDTGQIQVLRPPDPATGRRQPLTPAHRRTRPGRPMPSSADSDAV